MAKQVKGVYENPPESGIWWILYYVEGKRHREKVGRRSDAVALYQRRKTDARMGIKMPEIRPRRAVLFEEIAADGRSAWRQGYANSGGMSMADQLKQIGPFDGVASCEYKNRNVQGRNLIDQALALIRAELHWVAIWLGGGATMHTRQVAGLCHFPNSNERAFVEVDRIDLQVHGPMRRRYWPCAQ